MAKDAPSKAKAPKAKGGAEKPKKEKKAKDPNAPKVWPLALNTQLLRGRSLVCRRSEA